jgi:hypothetical protein
MNKKPLILLGVFLLITSCGAPAGSVDQNFNSSWQAVFQTEDFSRFEIAGVNISPAQSNVGIDVIYSLSEGETILGFAFQATVDGNGGNQSIIFRLSIYEGQYQGFVVVSHREHNGFGILQFNALTNQLPGTAANFSLVQQLLINANAGRAGISETYDGIMPAIEAMTEVYLSL